MPTPKCYRWDNREVSLDYLQGIYGFTIHDGADHIPAGATKVWYPTALRERGGKVTLASTAGAPLILIGAGYTATYDDGRLTFPMNMGNHAYQPRKGEHGTLGIKVVDSLPSAYIDQLGIAWNAHNPDQLPDADQGNNYMHVDVTWGIVDFPTPSVVVPPVVSQPPIAPPGGTTNTVTIPRALADELLRRMMGNQDAGDALLRYMNERPR